jgi:flagellar biosynthesis protein FliR
MGGLAPTIPLDPAAPAQGSELFALSAAYVSHLVLAAVRVLAAFSFNPLLGSARVPMRARVGLGLFATLVLFPFGTPDLEPLPVGPLEVAAEVLVGLLAGFAVTLIFGSIQFAAGLIGINSGFSFAGTINPMFDQGGGVMETFFTTLALLVFVQINGHHLFLAGLRELFDVVPVGGVTRLPGGPDRLLELAASLFVVGLKLALPVLAALLLADLAFGLLARVAPQFNLFALELPVKMLLGVATLALLLPVLVPRMAQIFRAIPQGMLQLAGL